MGGGGEDLRWQKRGERMIKRGDREKNDGSNDRRKHI